jgi:hypothetical protein
MEGQGPCVSFPHDAFEGAILSLLKEVDPADVLGGEPEGESTAVAAELAIKEQRARLVEAELAGDEGDVPALARVLRRLDSECRGLRRRLAEARQRERNPLSVAWAEMRSLLDVATTEKHRLRLRELLRDMIEEILVLITPRRSHRLCVIQIFFRDGGCRDMLIHYRSAARGREGFWCARSLKHSILTGKLDLHDKNAVSALSETLRSIDLGLLVDAME